MRPAPWHIQCSLFAGGKADVTVEGAITVRISVDAGHVRRADVESTRLVNAASALAGRPPAEVQHLVPLLFPVCGVAQGVACARAIEAAGGRPADAKLELARDVACLAEAAVSHVWQMAMTWPEAAGRPTAVERVRQARHAAAALHAALFEDKGTDALRGAFAEADARAAGARLADVTRELAEGESVLARRVIDEWREGFGRGSAITRAVGTLDLGTVGARLAADPAFADHPELGGPIDVSAFARQRRCPAVADLEAEHGRGVLTRLAARAFEACAAVDRLGASLDELLAWAGGNGHAHAASPSPGEGLGIADTARGPLVYRVTLGSGLVDDIRVVAPTDWTFHPRGALARGLEGAVATPTLERDAGWFVVALDPCVPWKVEVQDA
jgi:hypothetical protein